MAKQKIKTNEQAFKELFKNLSSVDTALLRERVLWVMETTVNSIEENPDAWKNGFVHPNAYIRLNKVVQEHLGFDK